MKIPAGATAAQVRELYAKAHAANASRVTAILRSEAPTKRTTIASVKACGIHAAVRREYRRRAEVVRAWGGLCLRLDLRTPNPANMSTGSSRLALAAMRRRHRRAASGLLSVTLGPRKAYPLPCRVLCVRIAPSVGLDPHDALPGSLKSIVDGIADALGLASDRDPRVEWSYDQRRGAPGEHAVEVLILPRYQP